MSKKLDITLPEISEQQQRAIELLLSGLKQKDIASELGITTETISRWRLDADFVAALNLARFERWHNTKQQLDNLVQQAIDSLSELLQSKSEKTRIDALKLFFSVVSFGMPADSMNVKKVEIELRKQHEINRFDTMALFD